MGKVHVLIGAGKLGRGYLADLFREAGYDLIFMEYSQELVNAMREQGYYTLYREREDGTGTDVIKFDNYEVYCTQSDYDKCVDILATAKTASVHTYDDGFRPIGHMLGDAVKRRVAEGNEAYLNVLISANYLNPDKTFYGYILEKLVSDDEKQYLDDKVGLITTLAYRGGYPPTEEMMQEDPIAVAATNYPELPAAEDAFKGEIPEGVNFLLLDRMSDRLNIKLWTANVRGALAAAVAKPKGYENMEDANQDPEVKKCSLLGWKEAYWGAMRHFNFTEEEFKRGARKDSKVYNRTTSDTVDRQLFGLKRKLGRDERFTGPALACLEFDRIPFFLAKGLAEAFKFNNQQDPDCAEILSFVEAEGIGAAVEKYCELDLENRLDRMLHGLVVAQYYNQTDVDSDAVDYQQ